MDLARRCGLGQDSTGLISVAPVRSHQSRGPGPPVVGNDLNGEGSRELAFGPCQTGGAPYDKTGVEVYVPDKGDVQIVGWERYVAEGLTVAGPSGDVRLDIVASGRAT